MLFIVFSLVLVVVLTIAFGSQGQSAQSTPQVMEEGSASLPSQTSYLYGDPHRQYHDPYYNRNPIFSPDRRYVWDGERWVSNQRGFGGGLLIGLIVGVVAALYLFSQY